jgi:hypothetical protein
MLALPKVRRLKDLRLNGKKQIECCLRCRQQQMFFIEFPFLRIFCICELCKVVLQDLHPSIVMGKNTFEESMTISIGALP